MFYAVKIKKTVVKLIIAALVVILAVLCVRAVNKYFPLNYTGLINENAKKYSLSSALVCAVINAESRFNPLAVSRKDAKGLMQLIDTTAVWGAAEIGIMDYNSNQIHDPKINIELGCWYLSRLLEQYGGDLTLALAAYNAGSGNVSKWLDNKEYSKNGTSLDYIPFKETRNYIEKVNIYIKIYEMLLKLNEIYPN